MLLAFSLALFSPQALPQFFLLRRSRSRLRSALHQRLQIRNDDDYDDYDDDESGDGKRLMDCYQAKLYFASP